MLDDGSADLSVRRAEIRVKRYHLDGDQHRQRRDFGHGVQALRRTGCLPGKLSDAANNPAILLALRSGGTRPRSAAKPVCNEAPLGDRARESPQHWHADARWVDVRLIESFNVADGHRQCLDR